MNSVVLIGFPSSDIWWLATRVKEDDEYIEVTKMARIVGNPVGAQLAVAFGWGIPLPFLKDDLLDNRIRLRKDEIFLVEAELNAMLKEIVEKYRQFTSPITVTTNLP